MSEPAARRAQALVEELQAQFASGADGPDWGLLERRIGVGRRQAERLLRRHGGTTPGRLWAAMKAEAAEALLRAGHDVLTAAVRSGHSGPGRLHDALVGRLGMTPGEVRSRGAGVAMAWRVVRTPFGEALLVATPRGLCALRLAGERSAAEHLADVRQEFPEASFTEGGPVVDAYAADLLAFLEGTTRAFEGAVDCSGTPFQQAVWEALRAVPAGTTITYGELARRLGRPKGARAVGQACARNGVGIAIPCHRAVGRTGGLTGYRWGEEWKRRLLELEGALGKGPPPPSPEDP